MSIFKWSEGIIHKMKWYDMSLIKLSAFAFGLLVAKLFPEILSLSWHYYLGFVIVFALFPMRHMFKG